MNRKYLLFISLAFCFVGGAAIYAQAETPIRSTDLESITLGNASRLESLVSLDGDIKFVSVSPDGAMIAIADQHQDNDYGITIFDLETGKQVSQMQGRMDFFRSLLWSPDSKKIATISGRTTGGGVEERSVKIYTMASGSNFHFYIVGNSDMWEADYIYPSDPPGNPVQIAWNPASDMLAVAFYQRMVIYDANEGAELISQPIDGLESVEWAADKIIITETSEGDINLWGVTPDAQISSKAKKAP